MIQIERKTLASKIVERLGERPQLGLGGPISALRALEKIIEKKPPDQITHSDTQLTDSAPPDSS
jgi:hypothetical protein